MKKRTAFIGAILSLIPFGQPLLIKTGVVLSTTSFMISLPDKVNANSADFYVKRGIEKFDSGNYYGAISDYTKAIEINPNDDDIYYNLGNARTSLEDFYGAIADYTKALEIKPAADAYFNRAFSKEQIGDLKGACSDWREASKFDHQNATQKVIDQC